MNWTIFYSPDQFHIEALFCHTQVFVIETPRSTDLLEVFIYDLFWYAPER